MEVDSRTMPGPLFVDVIATAAVLFVGCVPKPSHETRDGDRRDSESSFGERSVGP